MMRIAKDACVTIHFTLRDGAEQHAEVIDNTTDREPLVYLHGHGTMMPGLERALAGRHAGDKLDVVVPPDDAFGDWQQEYVQVVPRASLSHVEDLHVGLPLFAEGDEGSDLLTVVEINEDTVVVDGNHPLAGRTIRVNVEVLAVRAATAEELEQGTPATDDWR